MLEEALTHRVRQETLNEVNTKRCRAVVMVKEVVVSVVGEHFCCRLNKTKAFVKDLGKRCLFEPIDCLFSAALVDAMVVVVTMEISFRTMEVVLSTMAITAATYS